jgi:hypothetical protein
MARLSGPCTMDSSIKTLDSCHACDPMARLSGVRSLTLLPLVLLRLNTEGPASAHGQLSLTLSSVARC